MEFISDYDCTIEYHPGRANIVADALRRKSHSRLNALYACRVPLLTDLRSTGAYLGVDHQGALLANFQVQPVLLDCVLEAQMNDSKSHELKQVVLNGNMGDLRIRKPDGMLIQGDQMYVLNVEELKKEILEVHISAYAMPPGNTKMYHNIRPLYYWPRMKRETAEYMSRCSVCQQVKVERKKPFRLLQPLPIPRWKWEDITMDSVYKLPHTRNSYDGIWVIVDRLTKSVYFLPVRENYQLSRLAKLFVSKIVKYHGVLVSIIFIGTLDLLRNFG